MAEVISAALHASMNDVDLKALSENAFVIVIQPKNNSFSEELNITQASIFTRLAKGTIYQLVHADKIPFYKKRSRLYFSKEELSKWLLISKKEVCNG